MTAFFSVYICLYDSQKLGWVFAILLEVIFNVEMQRANALFLFLILISFSAHFQKKKTVLKTIMTTLLVFFYVVLNKLLNGGLSCLTYCIKCLLSLCLFISRDVCHYSEFSFSVWGEKGLMLLELCLGQIKWQNRNAHRRNAFTAYYIEYAEKSKTSRNFKRKSVCYLNVEGLLNLPLEWIKYRLHVHLIVRLEESK